MMDIFTESMEIAALGLGFVFFFLTLLVMLTALMSKTIAYLFPHTRIAPSNGKPSPMKTSTPGGVGAVDALTIAVITAAVHQHQMTTNQNP